MITLRLDQDAGIVEQLETLERQDRVHHVGGGTRERQDLGEGHGA